MKKSFRHITIFLMPVIMLCLSQVLCGCHSTGNAMEDDVLVIGGDTIDSLRLCQTFDSLIAVDKGSLPADRAMRRYYKDNHQLMWLSCDGMSPEADSVMAYIEKVGEIGFDKSHFFCKEIAEDRERLDSLDFSEYDVYTVIARMDMLLTKAFLRYAAGQRYGFTNPANLFNAMDRNMIDTSVVIYRQLYDVPTEKIGKRGYQHLASMAGTDSVSIVLQAAEPRSTLYTRLKEELQSVTGSDRHRVLVNMERCRWRHPHYPSEYDKYVLVNVPSYELLGVDGDSILEMRIVCGSHDTKTPLLNSSIMRMDINPRWVMPNSIIKHDIARHAGNAGYFTRHRYHIVEKASGTECNPANVSSDMLLSGGYRVYQEGGEGNSLGRIIFRFNNNFSIFLHDTSSKGTFERMDRRASHGCIRVQRPYDLACFLLEDKDEELMDKIKYSMTVSKPEKTENEEQGENNDEESDYDPSRIVHSVKVNPQVPLFITYYTLYVMPDGILHTYPDVYGYDPVIYDELQQFVTARK